MTGHVNDEVWGWVQKCRECGKPFALAPDEPPAVKNQDGTWTRRFVLKAPCGHAQPPAPEYCRVDFSSHLD